MRLSFFDFPNEGLMLYFAYGSNLDLNQMIERCPSARFVCKAKFNDHRLEFTRKSKNRGCGVADVIPTKGHDVWGVVYQIDERDIGQLDKSEGFRPGRQLEENAYLRTEYHVFAEGDMEKPLLVTIYIANKQENPPLPNSEYKSLIVEGAKYWHLPENYIKQLEQIKDQN
ncbi:MAG: gamma-glutamylcyclotransferase [Nitrospirae bacterium]|nr:gamma-glutamylcyclotransferase [Nitrospirota bacterium]